MRSICFLTVAFLLACPATPLLAAEDADPLAKTEPAAPAETKENRLATLFADLKRERNEKAAERIAKRIWDEWLQSGSSSIDLMMQWSQKAVEEKKYDVALDFLDEVIRLKPDYAEGWNRRASLHFVMSNYAKSMSDIDHTLALEPRHFGALSGMAQILKNTGRKELALQAYQRVLDIYPMMRSAQNELGALAEELAGEGI
jgi:tetratricopeptide (TPR) repeat protein